MMKKHWQGRAKGDHNAPGDSEHAVGPLGGVVGLEGQANLKNPEAQQDQSHSANKRKYKIRQIADYRQRVTASSGKGGGDGHGYGHGQGDGQGVGFLSSPLHLLLVLQGVLGVFHRL